MMVDPITSRLACRIYNGFTSSYILISLGLFFLWGIQLYCQVGASNEKKDIINVSMKLNTNYRMKEIPDAAMARFLDAVPWTQIDVGPGDSISEITAERMGVGTTKGKEMYSLLESKILERNGLSSPEDLKPGTLRVPILPKIAYQEWNEQKVMNHIPKIYLYTSREKDGLNNISLGDPKVFEQGRAASQSATVVYRLTFEELKQMAKDFPDVLANSSVENLPFTVNFDSQPQQDIKLVEVLSILDASTGELIRKITANPQKRNVYVFILDSGWPNKKEYQHSMNELDFILTQVKTNLRYPDSQMPNDLKSSETQFERNENGHCEFVEMSLREFTEIDQGKRVNVIYLPIICDKQSEKLLKDIVKTYLVIQRMGKYAGTEQPPKDVFKAVEIQAADILKTIMRAKGSKKTDKIIISALLAVLRQFSIKDRADNFYFINESWTAIEREFLDLHAAPSNCLIVAAAGNVANWDIYSNNVYFSCRSALHADTLAVININKEKKNIQCNSSCVPTDLAQIGFSNIRAVAFDGRLTENLCGTSFAAPRVAWLLALFMAYDEEVPQTLMFNRQNRLQNELMMIKDQNAPEYEKYWLDPFKFLERIK